VTAANEVIAQRLRLVEIVGPDLASGTPSILMLEPEVEKLLEGEVFGLQSFNLHHLLSVLQKVEKLAAR